MDKNKNSVLLRIIVIIFSITPTYSRNNVSSSKFFSRPLSVPVTSRTDVPLFTLTVNSGEQFFISLTAPFLVRRCDINNNNVPSIPCFSLPCITSRQFSPDTCPLATNAVSNGQCSCQAVSFDPNTNRCGTERLTFGDFSVDDVVISRVTYLCVPTIFLAGLQPGAFGVAGLSPSPLATWNQFSRSVFEQKLFGLCLPYSENNRLGEKGVIFFGGVPNAEVLTYTPLIRNPRKLNNYYIGLNGISIAGKDLQFQTNAFGFQSNGDGGVTLSTVVQYTTLRRDIYRVLLDGFSNATAGIPRAANVAPFGLCLQTGSIGSGQTGLEVPQIELKINGGLSSWVVYGANSLKRVSANVACLAFVDGGATAKQAVVIGSFQMENNLLVFDNQRLVFGFSSNLGSVDCACTQLQT